MGLDKITRIKKQYSVLDYARDVLGLPIQKSGDRCVSLAPDSHNPTAMIVYDDWWYDFKQAIGGDVIDLCAHARHGGNLGEAIKELAGVDRDWEYETQKRCNQITFWYQSLRDSDLKYLNRRGITKETVDRLRIGYDPTSDRLMIPYYKNGYVAYYVGRDRSGKDGVAKYKKAFLDGYNENIPWGLQSFEPKRRQEIEKNIPPEKLKIINKYGVIAEGMFDALSFEQEGFRVLSPISGYFNKDSRRQVMDILKTVNTVFVCFDNDTAGTRFTLDMCKQLFRNRIKFVCGVLPEGFKDVSEYYEAGQDLYELIKNAVPGIGVLANKITEKDEFKEFIYDAARFVDEEDLVELFENLTQFSPQWLAIVKKKALRMPPEKMIVKDLLLQYKIKYIEGLGFYQYVHGVWKKRSDNFISGYFVDLLGNWATGTKLTSLMKTLKAETTSEEFFNRKPVFNFLNGVLELETGKFREHSEADMSSIQVDYDYDENATCPAWEKFISEIMDEREASIKLIQEMTGYILYNDCSLQKCFFLVGDGANGKSVFLNVISAVFDEANVSNVEMSSLTEPFQRISLIDSLVNISTETKTDVRGAESIFKQIVTGDTINGCYKNKDFITFKPRCVLISACNEYVKSHDTTHGFLRRICFIDFPRSFEGEKADLDLEDKLKKQLPGIFNWAYEGYKRLKQQRQLTQTPEQVELLDEFRSIMNPVASFVKECLLEEKGRLSRSELYFRYVIWTKEAGHEAQSRTKFIPNFRKTIKQILPNVQEVKNNDRYFDFSERT